METAAFFAKAPPPKARGAAVVAASGGAAIMATDRAEQHGVPMPQPTPEVKAILEIAHPGVRLVAQSRATSPPQVLADPESLGICAGRAAGRSAVRRAGLAADLWLRAVGEAAAGLQRPGGAARQDGLRRLADRMAGRAGRGRGEPVRPGGAVPLDERVFRGAGGLALARGQAGGGRADRRGDAAATVIARTEALIAAAGGADVDRTRGQGRAGALRRAGGRRAAGRIGGRGGERRGRAGLSRWC